MAAHLFGLTISTGMVCKLERSTTDALPPGSYEIQLEGSMLADTAGNLLLGGSGGLAFNVQSFDAEQTICRILTIYATNRTLSVVSNLLQEADNGHLNQSFTDR